VPRLCCRARHMTPCSRKLATATKDRKDGGQKMLEEGIGLTARHRDAQRMEGRRVFELERVVSCRNADPWWRTKLDFGSGEPFDDLHWSTAFRAAPKIGTIFGGRGVLLFSLRLLFRTQQLKAKW
jgi:hypothetical protein